MVFKFCSKSPKFLFDMTPFEIIEFKKAFATKPCLARIEKFRVPNLLQILIILGN